MDTELIMGVVAYWFGFSLVASLHFFGREFKRLQSTLKLRLWRFALSLLLMVGVFAAAFFGGYVNRTFPTHDVYAKGLIAGCVVYLVFASLWTRYVKPPV